MGTSWNSLRRFCPLLPSDIWEQPVPQVYTWLPETPETETRGCIFSGVLFLPQGPTLEARHTLLQDPLHGIGID